jgi:hypothetical protein
LAKARLSSASSRLFAAGLGGGLGAGGSTLGTCPLWVNSRLSMAVSRAYLSRLIYHLLSFHLMVYVEFLSEQMAYLGFKSISNHHI